MGGEVEKQHYSSTPSPNKSLLARIGLPMVGRLSAKLTDEGVFPPPLVQGEVPRRGGEVKKRFTIQFI